MVELRRLGLAVLALAGAAACARGGSPVPPGSLGWEPQASGTTASLRGISVVSADVAWASGSGGTFLRTTDGGRTWRADTVPGATGLDFRDVHAADATTAYLMSAGDGALSRIYKTTDGGRSWTLQLTLSQGFLDGMAFRDARRGIALSDPVDGRFLVLATEDGGGAWRPLPPEGLPPALPGEAAFAASGTGIAVSGDNVWFGTGAGAQARVFRSADAGRTWTVTTLPMAGGSQGAGVFSLAFVDARRGVAVGGDFETPDDPTGNAARTEDGGRTWIAVAGAAPRGYRSGVAHVPGTAPPLLVAVGTSGSDYSTDFGESWSPIDTVGYNAVAAAGPDAVWAVGPRGSVARLRRGG
ncbi:MAG TPA: hypothetical protein VFX98_05890 [Longimicrobiaceae bacterium]|nr:hypothetical protein [Longimicrobiaceae bacterium]